MILSSADFCCRSERPARPCVRQGFGAAAKSTAECRHADPTAIVAFHQADIGQYIRSEDTLT